MSESLTFATIPHALVDRPVRPHGAVFDSANNPVDPVDEISEILLKNLEHPHLSENLLVWVDAMLDVGDPLGDVFVAWRTGEPYALVVDGERFHVFGPSRVAHYVVDPPSLLPCASGQLVAVVGNYSPTLYLDHGFFGRKEHKHAWPTLDFRGARGPDRPQLVTWYAPPLEVYVALYTTRPDGTPAEVDYPGYSRARAEFHNGVLGSDLLWPAVAVAMTVTHVQLLDAHGRPFELVEGVPFVPTRLDLPSILYAGDQVRVRAGELTMRLD